MKWPPLHTICAPWNISPLSLLPPALQNLSSQLQLSAAHAVAAEGLSCIRSIKAFGRHALVSHAFEVEAERACSLSLREYALHKCWNASNLLMAAAATCLVVREGSRRVFLGELSPGAARAVKGRKGL